MGLHEEFLELCAAATAGELTAAEQARLDAHLAVCPECCCARTDYEAVTVRGLAALAQDHDPKGQEVIGGSWSVENAEEAFFKRLNKEQRDRGFNLVGYNPSDKANTGQRFTYRPSLIRWREIWVPFAAAILLALALGVAAYRTGERRGTDVARTVPAPAKDSVGAIEEQTSDAGYERAQLVGKLAEDAKVIDDLKRQVSEQVKLVNSLKTVERARARSTPGEEQLGQGAREAGARRDGELASAQAKVRELQKEIDAVTAHREEVTARAAALETKVGDLTQLVRDREQVLDQKDGEVARQQELLEHDRDIRELMG